MKPRIKKLRKFILDKKHHQYRQYINNTEYQKIASKIQNPELSFTKRVSNRLIMLLEREEPVIIKNERITFLRTITEFPDIYLDEEWKEIEEGHYIHEAGKVCNITPDYASTIACGLEERKNTALNTLRNCKKKGDQEGVEYLQSIIAIIDAVIALANRYAVKAEENGRGDLAQILKKVPQYGAENFREALQSFRILHYVLWAAGNYHNTIGRFDQYMYPYLKADLEAGRLSEGDGFELLEEFFLTFNRDSDIYPGMQQGDNGQSLVLGGLAPDGGDLYNQLSEMCLRASLELKLIDPKINLRVHKDTPQEVYVLGTRLTKEGLGFPQYSNDDIVIQGLIEKGYDREDAYNYVVAACWEFIIPGVGMDIPNIGALSFANVISKSIYKNLIVSGTFEDFMELTRREIKQELNSITNSFDNLYLEPAPFLSILMDSCIEDGRDVSKGLKYNNYGIHGTGLSTAVDSLAAIKKYVFEEGSISKEQLLVLLNDNYEGHDEVWHKLRYNGPKFGNNDNFVDDIASELLMIFANSLSGIKNERGGCYRAGTGSAMYYLWHADQLKATADGRKYGEPLAANYSPSLFSRVNGPVSIIKSFAKPDLKKVINGGPLTLEMHDTVFRNEESLVKVAVLVKAFMDYGGHQIQLNAVNRETLLKAQKNPADYKNLIVRVWGWSGYFVELDKVYQDHIIDRIELQL